MALLIFFVYFDSVTHFLFEMGLFIQLNGFD